MGNSEYYKERRRVGRIKAFEHLGGKCTVCGSKENLEFDHIVPKSLGGPKSRNVSEMLHYKWETLVKELDLCQLLCTGCHIEKSLEDVPDDAPNKKGRFTHGRIRSYNRGCRCKPCRDIGKVYTDKHNLDRKRRRIEKSGKSERDLPRGVSRSRKKFRAQTSVNGKNVNLGTFETAEAASKAYVAYNANIRKDFDVSVSYGSMPK